MSARHDWSCAQFSLGLKIRATLTLIGLLICLGFIFSPRTVITLACQIASGIIVIAAILRWMACLAPLPRMHVAPDGFHWPNYTVLVPLHHEKEVVQGLMCGLSALDYPRDKLQILMICEADDHSTIAAVESHLTTLFDIVSVLPSLPRTKPKAMNVAMSRATGEIITIYDAEDRPHPQQLRQAALALAQNSNLAAVQAPLIYYNSRQNWLTRQFSIEYAALFQAMNPFYARCGLPFPLGGTSNHMRRDALEDSGLWDPHNVTEDADLSFRLAAFGWDIGMIGYGTQEEAVSNFKNWRNQRARWLKGFMQSYGVHMRRPLKGGWRRLFTLQITLGLTLTAAFLHFPAVFGLLVYAGWSLIFGQPTAFDASIWGTLIFGYSGAFACSAVGAVRAGQGHLLPSLLTMPLYWFLMFRAAIQAAKELITAPFHWNKTRHGDAKLYVPVTSQAHPLSASLCRKNQGHHDRLFPSAHTALPREDP
ncbi:glycosyltransferase family 2 protein [Robiginitomaculum antarcticum]|uniref:glycosyltransferase family 2 protein n=1 Tax=Robiginitomaculum antarcticum TaxID=437507 RepID=UPI0014613157|nr:glycosyltransferase family 2 protein [Robiginitomaculum antarcticum]